MTGYFTLEYAFIDGFTELPSRIHCDDKMPVHLKDAAKILPGGWCKNDRQIEEEKSYSRFSG